MNRSGRIGWGVLGTGSITSKLIAGARATTAAEIVAVGSRTVDRARSHAATFAIPTAHGSYDALLADDNVDVVYVALPNSLHHEWTMRALAAGKHVLCEKPYSRHPAEAEDAIAAARTGGVVFAEGLMWRYHPQVSRLLEVLPDDVHTIRASFSWAMESDIDVLLSPDLDGGSLMDVGCYCVSAARLVAGEEPDLAFGLADNGPGIVDRRFAGLLHFPSGIVAEVMSGFRANHRSLEVIGMTSTIMLTDPWQSTPALLFRDGVEESFEPLDPYQAEVENFCAVVRGEAEPAVATDDAIGQARAIDALMRSAETAQPTAP